MSSKYDDEDDEFYRRGGGGKYDDGDAFEGKHGGGGGGGGEGKASASVGLTLPSRGGGDPGVILPPIVQAFAHHVMSKKYRTAVEAFFKSNCSGFKRVQPGEEHPLEWTTVHQEYVSVVEQQLEDFCRKHAVTPEEVFLEVQDVITSGELDDELLPAILRVAEYTFFIEQITLTADHQELVQDAREGDGKFSSEDSLTGVWKVDAKRIDHDRLEDYLRAIRVPAVFRGLAKGTFFSKREVVIFHDRGKITIVSNSPFGMQRNEYALNDRIYQVPNPWGKDVPVRAVEERDGSVSITQCKPPNLPPGAEVVHTWALGAGGRSLLCNMEVRFDARDTVSFDLWYTRV